MSISAWLREREGEGKCDMKECIRECESMAKTLKYVLTVTLYP